MIVGAVAVALVAWWVGSGDDPKLAPLAPTELATPISSAGALVEAAAGPSPGAATLRSRAVAAMGVERVELECVDGASGAPIARARVHVLEVDAGWCEFAWNDELRWVGARAAAEIEARGLELVCDASGVVSLPRSGDALVVCAHHDELVGFGALADAELSRLRIELWPRRSLSARVVDALGGPARCDVALLVADENEVVWRAATDADGRVAIEDVDALVRVLGHASSTLAVRALVAAAPPVEELFDLSTLPEQELELRMRAAGALRVRVVDAQGELVRLSGEVGVVALDPLGRARETSDAAVELDAPIVDGTARLAPLGLDLAVRFRIFAGTVGFPEVACDGPRESGEERVVDVPTPEFASAVRGRLVDPSGAPCGRVACDVIAWAESERRSDWLASFDQRLISGEDGRFVLLVARRDLTQEGSPAPRLRIVCDTRATEAQRRTAAHVVSVDGSAPLDLGDIVLTETPVFARGFVRDDGGAAIARAPVALEIAFGGGSVTQWTADETRTATDGSFVVRAPCTVDSGWVSTQGLEPRAGEGSLSMEVSCEAQRVVDLVVGATGTIAGSCRADRDASRTPSFAFVREDGVRTHGWSTRFLDGAITFRMDAVPAGRGSLVIERDGHEIARIDGLEVPANGVAHDERLTSIDLRSELGRAAASARTAEIALRIVDERGEPIARGVVIARHGSTADAPRAGFARGRARLLVAEGTRLLVLAPGKLARTVDAQSEALVVLEDAPRAEIEIQGLERVVRAGDEVWVVLRGGPALDDARITDTVSTRDSPYADLHPSRTDAQGRARFSLPVEARYSILVRVVRRGDGSSDAYRSAETADLTLDAFEARRSSAPILVTTALTDAGLVEIAQALEEE